VSPEDGFHVRIGSSTYFEILFDNNEFVELDKNLTSKDPLHFVDTKKYADRLKDVMEKLNLKTRYVLELENQRKRSSNLLYGFCLYWRINGCCWVKNLKRNQSFYQNKSIHHDFKIRWSKNDGSGLFFDAISKTSVNLPSLLRKNTFHYVQTLLLEERLHLMLC
jgi:hypothetical protein